MQRACVEPRRRRIRGACASTGSVEVVFTATDACGNSTSYTGTFTIQDTTAPSFDGDLQLEFGCNDFDMAESYVSVEDACGDVDLDMGRH